MVRSTFVRVALVGPSWPHRGGIARTTTELARGLDEGGHLAAFLVPRSQYPSWLYPGRSDSDPEACPKVERAEPCFGVLEPWTWHGPVRRLREAGPDALVVPYWTAAWAPLALWLLAESAAAPIAIVHNPADHDSGWFSRRLAHEVLSRCRGFLCHSRSIADQLRAKFPAAALAVHPLPAGEVVPLDRAQARHRLGVAPDSVAVLFFGLVRPYKGVDVLLDAIASLPAGSPIVLLLAGEPWGRARRTLERRLAEPQLSGRVVAQLSWVPEREAAVWFSAADAVVLPYRTATGSAVAASALAYGLPVIGSGVGGLQEVITEGVNGLLVPPGRPEDLAAALSRAGDRTLLARLAEGARTSMAQWNWRSYAATLVDLTGRVVETSSKR